MKPLRDLIKKYRMLDDRFFYWWKAQSPVAVEALFFKLKVCGVAFAILSVSLIYLHNSSLCRAEAEAMRQNEQALVEGRKLKKIEQQEVLKQNRQTMTKPLSTMYR